jgi:hypothetical protein
MGGGVKVDQLIMNKPAGLDSLADILGEVAVDKVGMVEEQKTFHSNIGIILRIIVARMVIINLSDKAGGWQESS